MASRLVGTCLNRPLLANGFLVSPDWAAVLDIVVSIAPTRIEEYAVSCS